MFPFHRKPSRTAILEERVAALEEQMAKWAERLETWELDHLDDQDELMRAERQRKEIERLVASLKHWARARGFAFDVDATDDPMTQRAAQRSRAVKG